MIEGALISAPVVSRHGIFFWLLRTIVRVRYTFFLTTVLLGLRTASVGRLLVWTVVSFLAILLHEFGHAFAARYYGQDPKIEIHGFGASPGPESASSWAVSFTCTGPCLPGSNRSGCRWPAGTSCG